MADKRLVIFEGACLYAQVYAGQERAPHPDALEKKNAHPDDRSYSIQVECSEELHKKLLKAGISPLQALKEIEGKNYIRIKGTHTKIYVEKTTGAPKTTRFNDPEVVDVDGNKLDINTLIGNGSKVRVTAELAAFTGKTLKVLRLNKVEVLELVPYIKPAKTEDTIEVVLSETAYKEATTAPNTSNMF